MSSEHPLGHVQCLSERDFYSLMLKLHFHLLGEEQRSGGVYTQSSEAVLGREVRHPEGPQLAYFLKLNGSRTE